nr:hypothetical protein [Streptomyces sp. TRM70350]
MTVSGIDRLHSQLSKLEGMFPGYLTEIVEGSIVQVSADLELVLP